MMKQQHENIEREIDKTLRQLDEMKPLEVHHNFRVRLTERIDAEYADGSKKLISGFSKYLDARLAFMMLLLVINFGAALLSVQNNESQLLSTGKNEQLADNSGDDYTSQQYAYYDQTFSTSVATGGVETGNP
jgi:hypothetical protein